MGKYTFIFSMVTVFITINLHKIDMLFTFTWYNMKYKNYFTDEIGIEIVNGFSNLVDFQIFI